MLLNIIHTALLVCDGVRFHPGNSCDICGGTLSGYDARIKQFAILVNDDQASPVHIILQRSYCRNCGKITLPPEPFYPGTRVGSPVVDLCRSFSTVMPYNRVSTYLAMIGVQVDRWSVRHYATASLPTVPSIDVFGMKMPVSIISLSALAGNVRELGHLDMDDVLMACNYPSAISVPPELSYPEKAKGRSGCIHGKVYPDKCPQLPIIKSLSDVMPTDQHDR